MMIPKNMNEIMRQAQKMQEKMNKLQEELQNRQVSAGAGGGMVEATVNGKGQLLAVKLEKDVVNPEDTDMLCDLIVAAVAEAQRQAGQMMEEEMSAITGGLKMPGLF
ncbi:MAG: YbaB/EbfC family nucleoid-associated protein [Gracilibacteraceae bacterium]|jgi:DNA-binding YbaB/EbfC family protein|nr:YbaB/EbfC family nucleoid-associated protein [Gracilibacteraceae bacterium]